MRRRKTLGKLKRLSLLATLLLSVGFGAGCSHRETVVLPESHRIFVMKDGLPVFDGESYPLLEIEGYYVIAPGNVLNYLKWARSSADAKDATGIED